MDGTTLRHDSRKGEATCQRVVRPGRLSGHSGDRLKFGFSFGRDRSLGNERLSWKQERHSGTRGSPRKRGYPKSVLRDWWRILGAERLRVWSSGNVASGLASGLVLRDLNRSGVRESREGDDFGQNFLGVFRVLGRPGGRPLSGFRHPPSARTQNLEPGPRVRYELEPTGNAGGRRLATRVLCAHALSRTSAQSR